MLFYIELVLDNDWGHAQGCIQDPEHMIHERGTFLNPMVDDEGNNWANRGNFLSAYRELKLILEENELYDFLSFPESP